MANYLSFRKGVKATADEPVDFNKSKAGKRVKYFLILIYKVIAINDLNFLLILNTYYLVSFGYYIFWLTKGFGY